MSDGTLADVLPAVAASLGMPVRATAALRLPEARSAVVVLIDGLGEQLLTARGGHAPFLRELQRAEPTEGGSRGALSLLTGFPSTTATSMGMLGTGTMPGTHGLVGIDVLDPARDVLFSELAWDPAVDPRVWQPEPTVFELLAAGGLEVVRIGPGYFDGSGLTEAALRGGRFLAAQTLARRVDLAIEVARRPGRALVYLYWGEVDKIGHEHGCESWQWGEELSVVDRQLRRLVESVGSDVLVAITADHGMVDVAQADRLDVAHERDLAAGVRHVGGEPRALHLYCEPGAADDVLAAWRARLEGRMEIRLRREAISAGWFGPVNSRVLPRIGDVVVSATSAVAVVDSRTARPELLRLIGLHGARTPQEQLVPLIVTTGTG